MSLALLAVVTLGNCRYDAHVSVVTAHLAQLPDASTFDVRLPSRVEMGAGPGDPAALELDGGEGSATVLTGRIRTVRRGLDACQVVASDAGADLCAFHPAATYEKQSAKDVIRALASEVSAGLGSLNLDLPLAAYVAHQHRSAAEHVAILAQLAGAIAFTDGDGDLNVVPAPERADMALRYGREIIAYDVRDCPGPQVRRVAIGNGPAGSPSAPNALRPTVGALPGNAPTPGADAVWTAAPILRTPTTANAASQAMESLAASGARRVRARCLLLPQVRPGQVIEVQDLPEGLTGGPWLVTRAMHRLRPGLFGETVFEGRSVGGEGSPFAGALSAVGSVL